MSCNNKNSIKKHMRIIVKSIKKHISIIVNNIIEDNDIDCSKYGFRNQNKNINEYNKNQLIKGVIVEFEHFDKIYSLENIEKALCITMHHLDEFDDYYDRLEKIEN